MKDFKFTVWPQSQVCLTNSYESPVSMLSTGFMRVLSV